jgi:hypothetical protein
MKISLHLIQFCNFSLSLLYYLKFYNRIWTLSNFRNFSLIRQNDKRQKSQYHSYLFKHLKNIFVKVKTVKDENSLTDFFSN